jgi:hypothetical protein
MAWFCVRIPRRASSNVSAQTLVAMTRALHKEAGEPDDVAVYHDFTEGGDNLFYFSPGSETVFYHLLKFFGAYPWNKPPLLGALTQVLGAGRLPGKAGR